MSLRIPRLTTRSVAKPTRLFSTPPTNQTSSRPLLNSNTPLRKFAFYRRSVREEDVPVVPADLKVPRLPLGEITTQQEQYLWMQLRDGLSKGAYKDVAARVEIHVTDAVAAYARSRRAHSSSAGIIITVSTIISHIWLTGVYLVRAFTVGSTSDIASADHPSTVQGESGEEAATTPVVNITLIYKPPHPKFPGLEGTAAIDIRVLLNDGDVFPLLFELRHADDRIKFVFVQPEIIDADLRYT
ncbi:hypothetical protein KC330_g406 [Hortaea werneckii]|nr:hypothetical protein KC330_g406 [Hortaea werneckii]